MKSQHPRADTGNPGRQQLKQSYPDSVTLFHTSKLFADYLKNFITLNSIKSHKRHMSHGFRESNYITMIQFIVMM